MMRVDETRHRDKPATIDTTLWHARQAVPVPRPVIAPSSTAIHASLDLSPALVHRHEHIQVLDDKRRTKRDASYRSLLRSHIIVLSIAVRRAETFSEARQTEQKNRHHSNDHD